MSRVHSPKGTVRAVFSTVIVVAAAWTAYLDASVTTSLIASVGGIYFLIPPHGSMPRSLVILALLLLGAAMLGLAPCTQISLPFRQSLMAHGLDLPQSLSPQPWITLEDVTLLFTTMLWAWNCLELRLFPEQRSSLFRWLAAALVPVACVSILKDGSLWQGFPPYMPLFGQFPNRNQTGDILVMGGIISFSMGLRTVAKKKVIGLVWIALSLLFVAGMIRNGSRAALLLFPTGLGILFLALPSHRESRRLFFITVVTVALPGAVLFLSGFGGLTARFRHPLVGSEGRLAIYRDTWSLIEENPLTGVGLGNFQGVFNALRTVATRGPYRNIHPESDWFWLGAELGLPGVALVGLLVVETWRLYLVNTPYPPVTRISTTIATLFLVHSLWDVSGHRLGTVWTCMFVIGLGSARVAASKGIPIPSMVWRCCGILLLCIAGLRSQAISLNPWMPTSESVQFLGDAIPHQTSLLAQKNLLDRLIRWEPLNWLAYYQRGFISLQSPDLAASSQRDFRIALFLNPNSDDLPVLIDQDCRNSDLPEASVIRKELLDQAAAHNKPLFSRLYDPALDSQDDQGISSAAQGDPKLEIRAVILQDTDDFDTWRDRFLKTNPTLARIPPPLARQFFDRWAEVGDNAALIDLWPHQATWQEGGWRAYCVAEAKKGDYVKALQTAFHFLKRPIHKVTGTANLADAQAMFRSNPQDIYYGLQLFQAQNEGGFHDDAMKTLSTVAKLPECPDYVVFTLAERLEDLGRSQEAWMVLVPLVNRT